MKRRKIKILKTNKIKMMNLTMKKIAMRKNQPFPKNKRKIIFLNPTQTKIKEENSRGSLRTILKESLRTILKENLSPKVANLSSTIKTREETSPGTTITREANLLTKAVNLFINTDRFVPL